MLRWLASGLKAQRGDWDLVTGRGATVSCWRSSRPTWSHTQSGGGNVNSSCGWSGAGRRVRGPTISKIHKCGKDGGCYINTRSRTITSERCARWADVAKCDFVVSTSHRFLVANKAPAQSVPHTHTHSWLWLPRMLVLCVRVCVCDSVRSSQAPSCLQSRPVSYLPRRTYISENESSVLGFLTALKVDTHPFPRAVYICAIWTKILGCLWLFKLKVDRSLFGIFFFCLCNLPDSFFFLSSCGALKGSCS